MRAIKRPLLLNAFENTGSSTGRDHVIMVTSTQPVYATSLVDHLKTPLSEYDSPLVQVTPAEHAYMSADSLKTDQHYDAATTTLSL